MLLHILFIQVLHIYSGLYDVINSYQIFKMAATMKEVLVSTKLYNFINTHQILIQYAPK